MGANHSWCPIAVRGAVLRSEGQGSRAKTNGHIVELQPRNAEHHRVVAKLGDEHWQGLLMFKYYEVGVGNMRDVAGGYRAAVDDLEASGILEGCEWELVMAGEILV